MAVDQGILGSDAVTGDSGAVTGLAKYLTRKVGLVEDITSRLTGHATPGTWTGGSAAAYKKSLGDLPVEMDKLRDSFHSAASILTSYAHELHVCKLEADKLALRLEHETTALGHAQTAADDTSFKVTQAQAFHDLPGLVGVDKADAAKALVHAESTAADASAKLAGIKGEIAALKKSAASNRTSFEHSARDCVHRLGGASALGIRNKHYSELEKILNGVESAVGSVIHFLGSLLDDLSDLADLGSVLALIATVGLGILTVLTDGAAAPLFVASLDVLEDISAGKAALDAAEVAKGSKNWTVLLEDALAFGGGKAAEFPPGLKSDLDKALAAATRTGNKSQKDYAAYLRDLLNGKAVKTTGEKAAELTPELRNRLLELLQQSGCAKHSGSVPVS